MQAIVSINMDFHHLCLYILGSTGSTDKESVFFTPEPSHATGPASPDFHGAAAATAGLARLH